MKQQLLPALFVLSLTLPGLAAADLMARADTRSTSRLGGNEVSQEVSALSSPVYDANAIAGDLKGAAEGPGLTETDIQDCRNP